MDHGYPANPYSPPGSDVNAVVAGAGQTAELAERGTRLLAITIDGFLVCIPLLPMLVVGGYLAVQAQMEAVRAGIHEKAAQPFALDRPEMLVLLVGAVGIGFLGFLGIAIYQWVLISRTGQSLGKKWTGIRIERVDGARITFGSGVFLRNWLPKLIGSVPYLGAIFHLVDSLYIFREDRRCVHDHIAGTRVVRHQR